MYNSNQKHFLRGVFVLAGRLLYFRPLTRHTHFSSSAGAGFWRVFSSLISFYMYIMCLMQPLLTFWYRAFAPNTK